MQRDKADLFKFRRWIVLNWLDVFLLYLDWVDYKKIFFILLFIDADNAKSNISIPMTLYLQGCSLNK